MQEPTGEGTRGPHSISPDAPGRQPRGGVGCGGGVGVSKGGGRFAPIRVRRATFSILTASQETVVAHSPREALELDAQRQQIYERLGECFEQEHRRKKRFLTPFVGRTSPLRHNTRRTPNRQRPASTAVSDSIATRRGNSRRQARAEGDGQRQTDVRAGGYCAPYLPAPDTRPTYAPSFS